MAENWGPETDVDKKEPETPKEPEKEQEEQGEESKPVEEPEDKPEEPKEEKADEPKESEEPKVAPRLFSQEEVAKIATGIRKSGQSKQAVLEAKVTELEKKVQSQNKDQEEGEEPSEDQAKTQDYLSQTRTALSVETAKDFYGEDYWNDCYQIVVSEHSTDPSLEQKIMGSANVGKAVVKEAQRIIQEQKYGKSPDQMKAALRKEIEEEVRKEIEAKFKGRANQPTDVGSVRAAGGDSKPDQVRETWTTGKGAVPK